MLFICRSRGLHPIRCIRIHEDHFLSEQYLLATGLSCTILRNAFYLDMFFLRNLKLKM